MTHVHSTSFGRAEATTLLAALMLVLTTFAASAHPLGNFTINHYTRIEISADRVHLRYVIDMAEIPAFQELRAADTNGDGITSNAELQTYLQRVAPRYADSLMVNVDGRRVLFELTGKSISTPPGAGGLSTLRVECDFEGAIAQGDAGVAHRLRYEDQNDSDRTGWREIVVVPRTGVQVFNSSAFANGVTDEIKAYPEDKLLAPLTERVAELSFTRAAIPAGAILLRTREGRPFVQERDRFSELIAVPELTPALALLGLLVAAALGAVHALSPGHGKTIVGAYLIGSRGTARHAAFLGLTVTITHTIGVFALGLVTLFASRYVLPERLFPVLSLISGAIVFVVGIRLFVRRLRAALKSSRNDETHRHYHHDHAHLHSHDGARALDHTHEHDGANIAETYDSDAQVVTHSHGGRAHTHFPPGARGDRVTWRSLLALGISGGLLPCPSALVVMLSAIALHRVGYGLILVVAFSFGLACTLTCIGLAFVYAGRLMKRRINAGGRLLRWLPAVSALVIACLGAAICYRALIEAGINPLALLASPPGRQASSLSTFGVLGFGLVFGLKHAVEADHLAAVSTIVSERRSLLGSTIVGGLWGIGHTISLLIAGVTIILLHVRIGERMAPALEFCVALMLIALGVNAIRKLGRGSLLHFHAHRHGKHVHSHPHFHARSPETEAHTHHGLSFGARPLVVGLMHGLAGSTALMLLILSTIPAPFLGLLYVLVFGIGSIGGMMLMSLLVGFPVHLTAGRFARSHWVMRGLAGLFSLSFGLLMAYRIGFTDGLFR